MKHIFFLLLFALMPLYCFAEVTTPKDIIFVKDGLGSTEKLTLDEMDFNDLNLISCIQNVGWFESKGDRIKLRSGADLRFLQTRWKEFKFVFDSNDGTCNFDSGIAQYSLFLESALVHTYLVELTFVPRFGTAFLHTPNGDYTGEVKSYWTH